MKKYILPLLLAGLLVLGGCTSTVDGGALSPQEIMGLPEDTAERYPEMIAAVGESSEGESSSITLLETVGDGELIYLLYSVTVPDDWEQLIGSGKFRVTMDTACVSSDGLEGFGISNLPQRYDPRGHTIYFLAAFDFSEAYTGQTLIFRVENLQYINNENVPETLPDVHTVTWTASNTAPHVRGATKLAQAQLSPLGLELEMYLSEEPNTRTFEEDAAASLALAYRDGTELRCAAESEEAEQAEEAGLRLSLAAWDETARIYAAPEKGTLFQVEQAFSAGALGETVEFGS